MKSVNLTGTMAWKYFFNMVPTTPYVLVDREDGRVLEEVKPSQLRYLLTRKRIDKNGDVYYSVV